MAEVGRSTSHPHLSDWPGPIRFSMPTLIIRYFDDEPWVGSGDVNSKTRCKVMLVHFARSPEPQRRETGSDTLRSSAGLLRAE